MRPNRLALALALAMFALPMSVLAQESGGTADPAQETPAADAEEEVFPNWTWNLSATSDYVFRGVTQSNFGPALQGGLDYSFGDSGLYVGIWGSNVDFNDSDGPNLEIDTYVGWNHDVSEAVNLDLSLLHYGYSGERHDYGSIDYSEFIGAATWNEMLTFSVGYAPDYANLDYTSTWVNISGSWELGNEFSLNAGVGHSQFSDDNGNYTDWNIGVSRQFGPVNAALNYYDTNLDFDSADEHHRASDQLVLSLAFGNG
ncbi:MAG: TorF family putative porin [Variovorax sp.]